MAIKSVKLEKPSDVAEFLKEVKIMSKLKHPNIGLCRLDTSVHLHFLTRNFDLDGVQWNSWAQKWSMTGKA